MRSKMKIITTLLFVFSLNSMAASIEEVISGQRYDGIHRTQSGDFLATTADEGQVIRFNSEGTQSELLDGGIYFLGVTEDSQGNIYASDALSNQVYKINTNGQQEVFTTDITRPGNISQAPDGSLYIGSLANGGTGGVFQVNQTGFADLLISENLAIDPLASTFDSDGNYYFSNSSTAEIFRYTPNGEVSLFATLPITAPGFRLGHFVFIDGYLYAPGFPDNRIYRINQEGDIEIVVGPGATGEAGNFQLNGPAGVAAGNQPGEIYVTNYNSRVINRIQLDIADSSPIENPAGLSGLWFDPALDGEGYNIIYTSSGLLVYFYGYNDSGERIWLISEIYTEELNFGQSIDLSILEISGGTFALPALPAENATVWGNLNITFNDCISGEFILDGIDGIKVSQTQKLADIAGVVCE